VKEETVKESEEIEDDQSVINLI